MRVHSTESGDTIRLGRRGFFSLPVLVLPAAALVTAWAGMTNRLPPVPELAEAQAWVSQVTLPQLSLAELPLPHLSWLGATDTAADGVVLAPPASSPYEPAPGRAAHVETSARTSIAAAPTALAMDGLLDPGLTLGMAPVPLGQSAPLSSSFQMALTAPVAADAPPPMGAQAALAPDEQDDPEADLPGSAPAHSVLEVPTPAPRPFELRAPAVAEPRVLAPLQNRRTRAAALPAQPTDNRTFLEKLFNLKKPGDTTLAYATPQDDVIDAARGRRLSPIPPPAATSAQFTAIYDIKAKTVTMPNGERLEAHSGLGDKLDDPRFVHVRMRGATPPHVYDLSLREALFHGVRALRLNPVGGKEAIHGRDGLLAHTFMLGPNGDSNGCVSFRDYDKFLQAYLRGDVKRLVVVASM